MTPTLIRIPALSALVVLGIVALSIACGDDDSGAPSPTLDASSAPTATGTPALPEPEAAQRVFEQFVAAVQGDVIGDAWDLYIASIPGEDTDQHNGALGCSFVGFTAEFPRMQNMFGRIAPLELVESFGNAGDNLFIELKVRGADENEYLARLLRDPAHAGYRIQSFNNGRPALELGVPDPVPSPEDPQGFCAIWTGPR